MSRSRSRCCCRTHTVVKRAVDGSTCADVLGWQIGDLRDADRVILSAGGNDALEHIDLLEAAIEQRAKDVLVRLVRCTAARPLLLRRSFSP